MRKPHKTTIKALLKRKGDTPWRTLAVGLGLANYGLLNDIARGKGGSIEAENQVREKLGLRPLTKSGNHVHRPRRLVRPIVSREQNDRRTRLGVSWREIIEVGLEGLETLEGEMNDEALALWVEWFEKAGNPIVEDHESYESCFFCGQAEFDEKLHKEDCIYIRAKALVERKS